MTKVLVCTTTSRVGPYSDMLKLYGDPDHYAYKFGNESFADRLPIHMHQIYTDSYDSYHSVTIDYGTQKVYYGDNSRQKLYHANYVHNIIPPITTTSALHQKLARWSNLKHYSAIAFSVVGDQLVSTQHLSKTVCSIISQSAKLNVKHPFLIVVILHAIRGMRSLAYFY